MNEEELDRNTPLSLASIEDIALELHSRNINFVFAAQFLTGTDKDEEFFTYGGKNGKFINCYGLVEALKLMMSERMLDHFVLIDDDEDEEQD